MHLTSVLVGLFYTQQLVRDWVNVPEAPRTHTGAPEDIPDAKAASSVASSDTTSKSAASDTESGEPGIKRVPLINGSIDIEGRTIRVVRPEGTRDLQLTERKEAEGCINIVDICLELPGRYGGSVSVAQFVDNVEAIYETDDAGNEVLSHFEIAGNVTESLLFMPSLNGKGYFKLQVETQELLDLQKFVDNTLLSAESGSSFDMDCGVDFTVLEPAPQMSNVTKDVANQAGFLLARGKSIASDASVYVGSFFSSPQNQKPQSSPPVQTQTAQAQEPEEPDTPDLRLRKERIPHVSQVSAQSSL